MKFCTVNKYVEPVLEPIIRRVVCETLLFSSYIHAFAPCMLYCNYLLDEYIGVQVKEEVEMALQKYFANMKW